MEPKKFSITKLENARRNPKAFGSLLMDAVKEPFSSNPKSVRWLTAVANYHKNSNLSEAVNSLIESFSRRKQTKKNIAEVDTLITALYNYVNEHSSLSYTYFSHRHLLELTLSEKLKMNGWIWIINKTTNGYSGYTIVNNEDSNNWQSQLRFPIIQSYLAEKIFKCNVEKVEVGIINYYEGKHHRISYTTNEISLAFDELKLIGNEIFL